MRNTTALEDAGALFLILLIAGTAAFFLLKYFLIDPLKELSHGDRSGKIIVTDFTKPQAFKIFDDERYGADGFLIEVTGSIDGKANIFVLGNEATDEPYGESGATARLESGEQSIVGRGDWHETKCYVHFVPMGATKGELIIDYSLSTHPIYPVLNNVKTPELADKPQLH